MQALKNLLEATALFFRALLATLFTKRYLEKIGQPSNKLSRTLYVQGLLLIYGATSEMTSPSGNSVLFAYLHGDNEVIKRWVNHAIEVFDSKINRTWQLRNINFRRWLVRIIEAPFWKLAAIINVPLAITDTLWLRLPLVMRRITTLLVFIAIFVTFYGIGLWGVCKWAEKDRRVNDPSFNAQCVVLVTKEVPQKLYVQVNEWITNIIHPTPEEPSANQVIEIESVMPPAELEPEVIIKTEQTEELYPPFDIDSFGVDKIEGTLVSSSVSEFGPDRWIRSIIEIDGQLYQSDDRVYFMNYFRSDGPLLVTSGEHLAAPAEGTTQVDINYVGLISSYGGGILFDAYDSSAWNDMLSDEDRYIIDLYKNVWLPGAKGNNKSGIFFNITPDGYPEYPGEDYPAPWNICNSMRYRWWFAPGIESDIARLCPPETATFAFPDGYGLKGLLEDSDILDIGGGGTPDGYYPLSSVNLVLSNEGETWDYIGFFPNLPSKAKKYQALTCQNSPIPSVFTFVDENENHYMWETLYPENRNLIFGYHEYSDKYATDGVGVGTWIALIPSTALFDAKASDFNALVENLEFFQITQPFMSCN